MTRFAIVSCVLLLVLGLGTNVVRAEEIEIGIQVSPSTINLAYEGSVVTVHADISYHDVALTAELTLDGVPVWRTKADLRGELVAKFAVGDVKNLFEGMDLPTTAKLTLVGETVAGDTFHGTDTIMVIDKSGKK